MIGYFRTTENLQQLETLAAEFVRDTEEEEELQRFDTLITEVAFKCWNYYIAFLQL